MELVRVVRRIWDTEDKEMVSSSFNNRDRQYRQSSGRSSIVVEGIYKKKKSLLCKVFFRAEFLGDESLGDDAKLLLLS